MFYVLCGQQRLALTQPIFSSPGAAAPEPQTEGALKKWAVTIPNLPHTALGCWAQGLAFKTITVSIHHLSILLSEQPPSSEPDLRIQEAESLTSADLAPLRVGAVRGCD